MSLSEYNKKRNFDRTSEPKGKLFKSKKKLKFVVQHHFSSREHYDLRLEWNGVFVSFAVPRGPSYDTKDKRLAVHVEDHPISYGSFEGNIPEGEYGAGSVILWDKGEWIPKGNVDFNSQVKFTLKGERLKGDWTLVRFKDDNFLLIKERDGSKIVNINKFKTSIKTGRTLEEIRNNEVVFIEQEITNPNKVIFDKSKVTKNDIVDYYIDVSKRMMPFLDNRLISVVRSPSGINGEKFFMKHLNTKSKDIGKKSIKDKKGNSSDYYFIKNVNGLVSEVNMNSYEFHIWGSKVNFVSKPDLLVFDFDPDQGLALGKVRDGVRDLKKILDNLGLKSYLKTSGGKGYHVYVPINLPSFKKAEEISKSISELMVSTNPSKYTINMRKDNRKGKIFIDFFRNKKVATSVCPYSLRLKDKPSVSWPISFRDLDYVKPDEVTIKNYKKFLKRRDPWKGFYDL